MSVILLFLPSVSPPPRPPFLFLLYTTLLILHFSQHYLHSFSFIQFPLAPPPLSPYLHSVLSSSSSILFFSSFTSLVSHQHYLHSFCPVLFPLTLFFLFFLHHLAPSLSDTHHPISSFYTKLKTSQLQVWILPHRLVMLRGSKEWIRNNAFSNIPSVALCWV